MYREYDTIRCQIQWRSPSWIYFQCSSAILIQAHVYVPHSQKHEFRDFCNLFNSISIGVLPMSDLWDVTSPKICWVRPWFSPKAIVSISLLENRSHPIEQCRIVTLGQTIWSWRLRSGEGKNYSILSEKPPNDTYAPPWCKNSLLNEVPVAHSNCNMN